MGSSGGQGVVFSGSEEFFQSKLLNINLIMFQLIIDVIYIYTPTEVTVRIIDLTTSQESTSTLVQGNTSKESTLVQGNTSKESTLLQETRERRAP